MNLGQVLAKLRKNKGLNQRDFAQAIGMSSGAIAMWETNRRQPDLEMLLKISNYFNVSVDYLLGNSKFIAKHQISPLSFDDADHMEYSHETNRAEALSQQEKHPVANFPSSAEFLTDDEKDLLNYYHELSRKDQYWIMGQIVNLIKKADEYDCTTSNSVGS